MPTSHQEDAGRPEPPPAASVALTPPSPPRLDSLALFHGAVEIEIMHEGALYRLRQTRLGKLILTK